MKKIYYYLILIVVSSVALTSFWAYQKYFKQEESKLLFFEVKRRDLQEIIKTRGEIVAQKEFDLEFPFSGIVEKISVKEGQSVNQGDKLITLDTKDFELEQERLGALLAQSQSNLEKIVAGSTKEDIEVLEVRVFNAQKSLSDAKANLSNVKGTAEISLANLYDDVKDISNDSYYKADDAVNKQTDEMFTDDQSASPKLSFLTSDSQAKTDAEFGRLSSSTKLKNIKSNIDNLPPEHPGLDTVLIETSASLSVIRDFLARLSDAVNGAILSQTTITTYKGYVNTGRTNVNTAISNITTQQQLISAQKSTNQSSISTAETKVNEAQSSLTLAENELALKKAGARTEDIEIAKAQIKEIESQIAIVKEKINKSTLYAPGRSKVIKIYPEIKELFIPGKSAILLSAFDHKIQADISELEIGKIKEYNGNLVAIKLDAFPDIVFQGRVISVDPKVITKEGDTYFRANFYLSEHGEEVRSGMSADLAITISSKENALTIPELAVHERDGGKFVKISENGKQKEVLIETGISDGEFIEIIKGLNEGQVVAISAD